MSQFMKPTFGNKDRIGSPVNSVKNLQRKINRQERAHQDDLDAQYAARAKHAEEISQ